MAPATGNNPGSHLGLVRLPVAAREALFDECADCFAAMIPDREVRHLDSLVQIRLTAHCRSKAKLDNPEKPYVLLLQERLISLHCALPAIS